MQILNTKGKYPHEQVGADLKQAQYKKELAKKALLVFTVVVFTESIFFQFKIF